MTREIDEDREFSENVDRLLEGEEVKVGEEATDDYRTAVQFAQKLSSLRDEPSSAFKDGLRRQLLSKMAEQEAEAGRQRERRASFWETLRNMVPRSPVWRSAVATVMVVVLAAVVFWGSDIFIQAPEPMTERGPEPAMVPAPTPAPAPKAVPGEPPMMVTGSEDALGVEPLLTDDNGYRLGEEVRVDLLFRNTGAEPLTVSPFPPAVQINRADTGTTVRSFPPGSEIKQIAASGTASYTLVWDQLDDSGKQVEPGSYLVIVGNVILQRANQPQQEWASFEPVIELIIQSPQ